MMESATIQDAILIALQYIAFKDILSVSQTCKVLRQTCAAKQLWLHVWRRDILENNLPRPKDSDLLSLDSLGDSQMKALVIHTLRLHHELTCPHARRDTQRVTSLGSRAITWIRLVCGTWLLAAMSDAEASVLSLYSVRSLLGTRSEDLLAQAYLEGPVLNGLVEVTEKGVIIALELRTKTSTVELLSVQCDQGSYQFVRLARHSGISHIRALHGPSLGFALHEELSIPSILSWRTGSVIHLSRGPDADGGVVAMTIDDDFVIYLTPRKLHVMKISPHEEGPARYSTIAMFGFDKTIWHASLAFCQDDHRRTIQLCISNSGGMYIYSAPITHPASTQTSPQMTLLWSRQVTGSIGPEHESPFRMITHPLIDQTSTTFSWLESASDSRLSRRLPSPVQFVTITERVSDAQSPLQDPPCFELSERNMPALYAQSTRDYDQGLGLLAIGNMIGELALFSFGRDTFSAVQDLLRTDVAPSWDGQELLPHKPFIPYPPRPYSVAGLATPTDEDKQSQEDEWCKHWPQGLELPVGWRRCSAFGWAEGMRFLDATGNKAWELGNACHFLGWVIPLISNRDSAATLITVGGLFLLYHAPIDLDEPFVTVLRPELSLEEIVAQLPESFYEDEMGDAVVNVTSPDWGLYDELRSIALLGAWEQRHGINRWGQFKERGGKAVISAVWEDIREGRSLHDRVELLCADPDECPICA